MTKKDWIIILVIPLVVSISTVIFEFIINSKDIEISFFENRHRTASPNEENRISKIVNNDLNKLSVSKIEIKNTGDIGIKNFNILLKYQNVSSDFELLKSYHRTIPEYEFGNIQESKKGNIINVKYKILNPGEISIIETSLKGDYKNVELFSKLENLSISQNKYAFSPHKEFKYSMQLILILTSFMVGLLILYFKNNKKIEKHWKEIEKAVKYYDKKKNKK